MARHPITPDLDARIDGVQVLAQHVGGVVFGVHVGTEQVHTAV